MELSMVLAFALAALVISVVPGPDMMFIIATGIARGRLAGAVAAVGMSTGIVVHTAAAALGLGALLQAMPAALDVIRIAGAVILVYLAISTLRSARGPPPDTTAPVPSGSGTRSLWRTYVFAVLTNVANAKVILFYLAFVPQFLTSGGWPTAVQLLVLGGILIVIGLTVDATVGLAAGTLSALLLRRPGVRRWLNRVSAAIFGALAVRLVTDT